MTESSCWSRSLSISNSFSVWARSPRSACTCIKVRQAASCSGSRERRRCAAPPARSRSPISIDWFMSRVDASATSLAQTLALDQEPVLEGRVAHLDTVEQIAAVERNGAGNRFRRSVAQQQFEGPDVHRHRFTVDHHRLAFGDQRHWGDVAEGAAQPQEAPASSCRAPASRRCCPKAEPRAFPASRARRARPPGSPSKARSFWPESSMTCPVSRRRRNPPKREISSTGRVPSWLMGRCEFSLTACPSIRFNDSFPIDTTSDSRCLS